MLIRYDPRGSGVSDRDAADYSFAAWVADLEAVVETTDPLTLQFIDRCRPRPRDALGRCGRGGASAEGPEGSRNPDRWQQQLFADVIQTMFQGLPELEKRVLTESAEVEIDLINFTWLILAAPRNRPDVFPPGQA